MIDLFTLALTHGLMALAAILLLGRDDLDAEGGTKRAKPWLAKRPTGSPTSTDTPGD